MLGTALSLCKITTSQSNSQMYESILTNLAHCHRKQKDFESAIGLYEQCLNINSQVPSTYAALGFSYHQIGKIDEALKFYHKAHFFNNDDSMIEQLVQKALEDLHEFPSEEFE